MRILHLRLVSIRALLSVALSLVALFWSGGGSGVARADIDSEQVRAGMRAYEQLEYARSIELLQLALKETLTREERVAAYRTLAFDLVALEQQVEAREAFEALLRLDPGYEPDHAISPRVRAVFEAAREHVSTEGVPGATTWGRSTLPSVRPTLGPERPRAGQAITLRLAYPGGYAERMEVYFRTRGLVRFNKVEVPNERGQFEATIPGLAVSAPGLEWYAVLLDENRLPVATAGSLGSPMMVEIGGASTLHKKAWFWAAVGGGAVVIAVVAGVLGATLGGRVSPDTPAMLTIHPQ